jgi:hypothetical protein
MGQKDGKGGTKRRIAGRPQALAVSLTKVTEKALGNRSLAERGLIVDWASVVGQEIAELCHPAKLTFDRRDRRMDGTLTLRVRPGQATRVQHLEPVLLERINGYFGYRALARLRLQQAPPAETREDPSATAGAPDGGSPGGQGEEAVADPDLRAALARLGRAIKERP